MNIMQHMEIKRMNQIMHWIKKNYIYVNITLLFFCIYVILFPIIAIPIKTIFPTFNECTYLKVTGKPCPLCGGTRYIQNLPKAFTDITYLFHPFGIIMLFLLFEIIYRMYQILTRKKEKTEKQIKIDFCIHLFALLCFSLYELLFLWTTN